MWDEYRRPDVRLDAPESAMLRLDARPARCRDVRRPRAAILPTIPAANSAALESSAAAEVSASGQERVSAEQRFAPRMYPTKLTLRAACLSESSMEWWPHDAQVARLTAVPQRRAADSPDE